MNFVLQSWQLLFAILVGWVSRRQQEIIEFQNAQIERFFRSLKSECVARMIFFSDKSLRRAVRDYLSHYHAERNHQGLANELIAPGEEVGAIAGKIGSRE